MSAGEEPAALSVGASLAPYAGPGSLRRAHDATLRRLLALGDVTAAMLALAAALVLSDQARPGRRLLWGAIVIPLIVILFKLYGLYDRDVRRISHSTVDDLPWVFHATMAATLLLWLYSRVSPLGRLDVLGATLFAAFVVVLVMLLRAALRSVARNLLAPETALLVGGGEMAGMLAAKLRAHPEHGLRVVGLLTGDRSASSSQDGLHVLGTMTELAQIATQANASRVIVSPAELDEVQLEQLLRRCRALSLKVTLVPQLSDLLGPAVEIDDVEGVTLLGVNPPWLPRSSRAVKRAMDVVLAGAILIGLAPLWLLIAIAIKLDSRGPVLFSQERVGRDGRHFRLLKFRTMVQGAEQSREQLLARSSDPNWLLLERDPRITAVGRPLRRLSLDEIPQLWNVLCGEMSMVGPRPLIPAEDDLVKSWGRGRLDLTPGITGYWQVLGRTRIPFEEMVKLDYLYAMNWSLWADLRLILRTLPAIFTGRGAN